MWNKQNTRIKFFNVSPKTDNTGKITISDLRGVYTAKHHPKFISGKMTEDEVFGEFLQTFTQSTKVHAKLWLNIELWIQYQWLSRANKWNSEISSHSESLTQMILWLDSQIRKRVRQIESKWYQGRESLIYVFFLLFFLWFFYFLVASKYNVCHCHELLAIAYCHHQQTFSASKRSEMGRVLQLLSRHLLLHRLGRVLWRHDATSLEALSFQKK